MKKQVRDKEDKVSGSKTHLKWTREEENKGNGGETIENILIFKIFTKYKIQKTAIQSSLQSTGITIFLCIFSESLYI